MKLNIHVVADLLLPAPTPTILQIEAAEIAGVQTLENPIVLVAPVKVMLAPAAVPPPLVVSMAVAPPSSTGPVSVKVPPAVRYVPFRVVLVVPM